jgi:hypothetical protein
MARNNRSGGRHGRIRPHERDTNNAVPIIGVDIEVTEEHRDSVRTTLNNDRVEETRRDYRNRIKEICTFLQEKYHDYCDAGGIRELTEQEKANPEFFYHTNTLDLKYEGMNAKLILAFLAMKKTKPNGKTTSFSHIRKYHDAILYGAESIKERLPIEYFEEMEKFLNAFKKECARAKAEGNLDEREADPLSWGLFRIILTWALSENNIFVWVFSLLQWGCMARSISIGVLAFHNFRLGDDNIICRYDKHKSDQTGETAHDKHLFANPFDGLVNLFLALGVWFAIERAQFATSEDLFKREGTEDGAASHRYCQQLMELFQKNKETLGKRATNANTRNGTMDEFQAAFGDAANAVTVTPRMQELEERIQVGVQEEARRYEVERRAERNRVGDAVGTEGTVLFVQQRPRGQLQNDGHLSHAERQQYAHSLNSMICAAGDRCQMNGAPAPSTHRCPFCDRHIHAICGIVIENAPNEFHNRRCFDCVTN